MRDDICTIPVTEIFEVNDGCPICRMHDTVEARIIDYIMGAAMMEPDIRIMTNKLGFCESHYDMMLNHKGRLSLALILQSHLGEIEKNLLNKKGTKVKNSEPSVTESCFVCEKVEWGLSRMIETLYRTYEKESDFRDMFNSQPMFCLPHYERLINGSGKKVMRKHGKEFSENINRITGNYLKSLYSDVSKYCSMYDYRSNKSDDWGNFKNAIERTIAFLNGRLTRVEPVTPDK